MLLRLLEVEGLGCFANALTAGPFAPGINILHAPNGTGKSTLFRALALGLVEPHRAKSEEVKALRPWGTRLAPRVGIEFEHAGRLYRLRKQFLDGPSSQLETGDGKTWTSFARSDSADEFLREVLRTNSDKPRSSKPEHWGFSQILWSTQGELKLPALSPNVVDCIHASIGAHLTADGALVETKIEQEYARFFTPATGKLKSGKNAVRQTRLEAERDALAGRMQAAEDVLRQFEIASTEIERLQTDASNYAMQREKLASECAGLRDCVAAYQKLLAEQSERMSQQEAAQSKQKMLRDRMENIDRRSKQVNALESELRNLTVQIEEAAIGFNAKREAAGFAEGRVELAAEAVKQARATAAKAQRARDYVRTVEDRESIAKRLFGLMEEQARLKAASDHRAALVAPTASEMRALRQSLDREHEARRRLELARITVSFMPENAIRIEVHAGEQPGVLQAQEGVAVRLLGSPNLAFSIPGAGRFEVNGPVTDFAGLRKKLEEERAALAAFASRFDTMDCEVLEQRRQLEAQLTADLRKATDAIAMLLGGATETELRDRHSALDARVQEYTQAHPEWLQSPPHDMALTRQADEAARRAAEELDAANAAAKTALAEMAAAELQVERLRTRLKENTESLGREQLSLAHSRQDGMNEQQRQGAFDEAVLDYDRCKLALSEVNRQLQAFPQDPTLACERLKQQLAIVEELAASARENFLRAETRIADLAAKCPYSAFAEASEQLSIIEAELAREKREMQALSLLRNVLVDVKSAMLASLAAPVEKLATQYLDEICGKPIAQIRLNGDFGSGGVVPVQLSREIDSAVDVDRLSGGEKEQVFLCTRLALAEELSGAERHTLVMDDVLTSTDPQRLSRICNLLSRSSDRFQIVILTCQPNRFAAIRNANRIDLSRLAGSPQAIETFA
jgi:DNA repair exonuclease SbcCD ATPase subunit